MWNSQHFAPVRVNRRIAKLYNCFSALLRNQRFCPDQIATPYSSGGKTKTRGPNPGRQVFDVAYFNKCSNIRFHCYQKSQKVCVTSGMQQTNNKCGFFPFVFQESFTGGTSPDFYLTTSLALRLVYKCGFLFKKFAHRWHNLFFLICLLQLWMFFSQLFF